MELFCYVLTRDFDEFATAHKKNFLLRIMKFVEESETNLASASQTLYLGGDPASGKDKIQVPAREENYRCERMERNCLPRARLR